MSLSSLAVRTMARLLGVPMGDPAASPETALAPSPSTEPTPRRSDTPRPPQKAYRDLPLYDGREFSNVATVRTALTQLSSGDFEQAALMVDAMIADDRISGVWSCRADGLLGLPIEMGTAIGLEKDAKALQIAQEAARVWAPLMGPESALAELLKWGRFLGLGIAEKIYERGNWIPKLKVWHPRFYKWDTQTRTIWLLTEDEGRIKLDHNDPAVRRKWVFYAPFGLERGWMNGRVRPLAIPWIIRQWSWRDHARHNEVHGVPIRKVKVPAEWDDEEQRKALREVAQLAAESVVRCPVDQEGNGMDVSLVEAAENSYEAFVSLAGRADVAIAVVLLGQNLTTEVADKGSRAAAQVHDRVRQDVIRSDNNTMSTCLHEQVIQDWTEFHHGDRALAPWPCWDIVPPRDEMQLATALRALFDAFLSARATRLPVDFRKMAEKYGIPLEAGKEIPDDWKDPIVEAAEIKAASGGGGGAADDASGAGAGGRAGRAGGARAAALMALAGVPPGMLRGQLYADDLQEGARRRIPVAMSGYLARVLAAIEGAGSYADVRQRVLEVFQEEAKPEELARLVEHAMVLAELNGRLSVREDRPGAAED